MSSPFGGSHSGGGHATSPGHGSEHHTHDEGGGIGWTNAQALQHSKSSSALAGHHSKTLDFSSDQLRMDALEKARKIVENEDESMMFDATAPDVPEEGWFMRNFQSAMGMLYHATGRGPGDRAAHHRESSRHMRKSKLKEKRAMAAGGLLEEDEEDRIDDKQRILAAGEYALLRQQEAIHRDSETCMVRVGFGSKMISPILKSTERARESLELEMKLQEERQAAEAAIEAKNLHEWLDAGLVRDQMDGRIRGKKPLPIEYQFAEWATPNVPAVKHKDNSVVTWPIRFDLVQLFMQYDESEVPTTNSSTTTVFHYTSYKNFRRIVAPPRMLYEEDDTQAAKNLSYAEEIWDRIDDDLCSRRIPEIPGASEFSLALLATEPGRYENREHIAGRVFRTEQHLKQRLPSVSYCIALRVPTDKCLALAGQEYRDIVLVLAPGEAPPDEAEGADAAHKKGLFVSWHLRNAFHDEHEESLLDKVKNMNLLDGILDRNTGEIVLHHHHEHHHHLKDHLHNKEGEKPPAITDAGHSQEASKEEAAKHPPGHAQHGHAANGPHHGHGHGHGQHGDNDGKKEASDEQEEQLIEKLTELDKQKELIVRKIRHAERAIERSEFGEVVHFLTTDQYRRKKLEKQLMKIEHKVADVQKELRSLEESSTIVMKTNMAGPPTGPGGRRASNLPAADSIDDSKQRVMRRRRNKNKNATEFVGEVQNFVHEISEEYHSLAGDIFREVFGGHIAGVEDWLEAKGDPNSHDPASGWTPLLIAVFMGDPKMVRLLYEKNSNPNIGSLAEGLVPMHLAARSATTEMVRFLISLGGMCARSVREKAKDGTTPLMTAIAEGHPTVRDEMVRLMLDSHADPNAERSDGWCPLSVAVRNNYKKAVRLLIQHGGKVLMDIPNPDMNKYPTLTIWQLSNTHPGLQNLIKSKLSSRDLQQLEKRYPGTLGLEKHQVKRQMWDEDEDLF